MAYDGQRANSFRQASGTGALVQIRPGHYVGVSRLPGGPSIRKDIVDRLRYFSQPVVRRNYEASRDVASLGPIATRNSTYALQEYFVPRAHLSVFVTQMASILQTHSVNAVNISIRHSPPDPYTCLSWAREEVFSFVLYYWQHVSLADREEVGVWTRKLIDAALSFGGATICLTSCMRRRSSSHVPIPAPCAYSHLRKNSIRKCDSETNYGTNTTLGSTTRTPEKQPDVA